MNETNGQQPVPLDTTGMTGDERAAAYCYADMIGAAVDDVAEVRGGLSLRRAICWARGHNCPDGGLRRPVESSARGQWFIATCRTCYQQVEVFVAVALVLGASLLWLVSRC